MSDQSLFEGEEEQSTQTQQTQSNTEFADLLNSIKNENGDAKYDSLPKALEGLRNAQEYIPKLKDELSSKDNEITELREQLLKMKTVEETIEGLKNSQEQQGTPSEVGLGEKDVEALLERMLTTKEKEGTRKSNISAVTKSMTEKFGDKAEEVFYAKASELGLSKDMFNTLASESPKAVLSMFEGVKDKINVTTSSQNTTSMYSGEDAYKPVERADKSILFGATSKELAAEMSRHKEAILRKYNIT